MMRALTIKRPWTDAILRWPGKHRKRIENRGWWSKAALGHPLAIHAGLGYEREAAEFIDELAEGAGIEWRAPRSSYSPLGVVGVATFCGVVAAGDEGKAKLIAGRYPKAGLVWAEWWMGGIGWLFDDEVAIEPVPCSGKQGVWWLPDDVERVVRERWDAARAA